MSSRDIIYGRQGGRVVDYQHRPTTCIHCKGPLPAGRWLFCTSVHADDARAAIRASRPTN